MLKHISTSTSSPKFIMSSFSKEKNHMYCEEINSTKNLKNMTKFCKICQSEIPPKRVEILPHTETCVNCSDAKPYKAVSVTLGEGDHTWNDIQIMTDEQYQKYQKLEKTTQESLQKDPILDIFNEEEFEPSKKSPTVDDVDKDFLKIFEDDNWGDEDDDLKDVEEIEEDLSDEDFE